MARPFTRHGGLGPLVQVSPPDHWTAGLEVAVQPGGTAVVTWTRVTDGGGYEPWMRTLAPDGRLGTARRVGDGPNAPAPLVVLSRTGGATLVWTNTHVYARPVSAAGRLGPTRRVRRAPSSDQAFSVSDIGVDRRGIIVAVGTRWTRNTAVWPQQDNSHEVTGWFRISPRLRLMAPIRRIAPRTETIDHVSVAVSDSGHAIVGWQRNYYDGAFVRQVAPDGSIGRVRRLSDGALGEAVLRGDGDGAIASSGSDAVGWKAVAWVTPVRDGRILRSRQVGSIDGSDITYLHAGITGPGRSLVTWAEAYEPARILSATRRVR